MVFDSKGVSRKVFWNVLVRDSCRLGAAGLVRVNDP